MPASTTLEDHLVTRYPDDTVPEAAARRAAVLRAALRRVRAAEVMERATFKRCPQCARDLPLESFHRKLRAAGRARLLVQGVPTRPTLSDDAGPERGGRWGFGAPGGVFPLLPHYLYMEALL